MRCDRRPTTSRSVAAPWPRPATDRRAQRTPPARTSAERTLRQPSGRQPWALRLPPANAHSSTATAKPAMARPPTTRGIVLLPLADVAASVAALSGTVPAAGAAEGLAATTGAEPASGAAATGCEGSGGAAAGTDAEPL